MTALVLTHAMVVDVESRSAIKLPKVGTWRYAMHATTSLLCLAYGLVAETGEPAVWIPGEPVPDDLAEHLEAGGVIAAWNVAFDMAMLNRFLPSGIRRITIHQVHDIAAQAASAGMPRAVENCAKAMGIGLTKDKEGQNAMRYLMQPRSWVDGQPVFKEDPVRFQALVRYCQGDVKMERLMMRRLPQLQSVDRPVFVQDLRIVQRGMRIDRRLVEVGGPALMQALAAADQKLQDATDGAIRGVSKREDFVAFLRAQGVALVVPEEVEAVTGGVAEVTENHGDLLHTAAVDPEEIDEATGAGGGAADSSENSAAEDGEVAVKASTKGAMTKSAVLSYLARDDLPPVVRTVLELRREYGRTSTAKLKTLASTLDPKDDRTRDYLVYHGAATGRASGKLIQPQNLPRDSFAAAVWEERLADLAALPAEVFHVKHQMGVVSALVRLIRGAIVPSPGHRLVGGDFSRIELMVGAWLAGASQLLEDLGAGVDVYQEMATRIYGVALAEVTEAQRQVAKSACLGCMFQLGSKAFQAYVLASTRIAIDEATAERIVTLFRATYPEFIDAWRDAGQAAQRSVMRPDTEVSCLGDKVVWRCLSSREWMIAGLPSGRRLRFYRPTLNWETNKFGNEQLVLRSWGVSSRTHQWSNEIRHGGLCFQNAVQAVARDILMAAVLRVEAAGIPVLLHVHDELVVEVPLDSRIDKDDVKRLMEVIPAWAHGIPVTAKCWSGMRYGKS